MNTTRVAALLGAAVVSTGVLSACGSDNVPGDSVVRVGDTTIKNTTFNHWLKVAALSTAAQTQQTTGSKPPKVAIPDQPKYTQCIAQKKSSAPKPAKGQPKVTDAQYKAQCQQEYEGLRDEVLQYLISAQWIEGAAADKNVKVSDSEVNKQFATLKKQSFPKPADYTKFLATSGYSQADLLFKTKIDALSTKLRNKITSGQDKVSDAQVSSYYDKNKTRFAQPERRDLRIVLTKTQAQANTALSALKGGQSFKVVAKKYSIDQTSKNQGGVLLAVAKGQQEKAFDSAIFSAPAHKLQGPVKTQFGYYDFIVGKVTKASQQTEKQAAPAIKQILSSQNQQKALQDFVKDFQKKWKKKTKCRKGFVTDVCSNAPKKKSSTTSGAAGAAQQQVPQQQQVPVQPSNGSGSSGSGSGSSGSGSGSSGG